MVTLDECLPAGAGLSGATGGLNQILHGISMAAKRINTELNKGALADLQGSAGSVNVHGEVILELDRFANDEFVNTLKRSAACAGIAGEEMESFIAFDDHAGRGAEYICLIDPLDGSTNIDVGAPTGSIFSVYRRLTEKGSLPALEDFLQPGHRQVAAGYILYGTAAVMICATAHGVNGFTLDPVTGEFVLVHPAIGCPARGETYSVNYGYYAGFPAAVRVYLNWCQRSKGANGNGYSLRYSGSLVADFHRNLLKGGIFLYPATRRRPEGKLRLQYECNPLAFIAKAAGAGAGNGEQDILDIVPHSLHQRTASM